MAQFSPISQEALGPDGFKGAIHNQREGELGKRRFEYRMRG
jgi:hypothetical protein